MKRIIVLTGLLLIGCGASTNFEVQLIIPNADGLSTYSPVILNGLKVGTIRSMGIGDSNQIVAVLSFDKGYELPSDSQFIINKDFLGTASIDIQIGSNKKFLQNNQQVIAQVAENHHTIKESGINIIGTFSQMLEKQDSILIELRRLNKNLEASRTPK